MFCVQYAVRGEVFFFYLTVKCLMWKLYTLVANFLDTYKLTEQIEISKTYSFPKSYVSYRKPREVSIEQRERARQMMVAKNRAKKEQGKFIGIMYAFVVR